MMGQTWDPSAYKHRAGFVVDHGRPLVKLLQQPAGARVLDLGCGDGALTQSLSDRGYEVIALDRSAAQVAAARGRGLTAIVGNGSELPFHDGQVDLVTVIHTLHEFEDLPGFLQQVKALLRPSGRMLVVEPGGHVKAEHFAAELQCCREAGFREIQGPDYSRRRMSALLVPIDDGA